MHELFLNGCIKSKELRLVYSKFQKGEVLNPALARAYGHLTEEERDQFKVGYVLLVLLVLLVLTEFLFDISYPSFSSWREIF